MLVTLSARYAVMETQILLDQPRPPTAVFVGADQMALGAYEALYERGLRVPDDMSIVGFDDLDEARWAIPPLTTVRQPLTEMAGMATLVRPEGALLAQLLRRSWQPPSVCHSSAEQSLRRRSRSDDPRYMPRCPMRILTLRRSLY